MVLLFFALIEDMWQERYFTLFRQQCLSNVDKGEVQRCELAVNVETDI